MFSLFPENISPMKIANIALRIGGFLNNKDKPWTYLVTTYHSIILFIFVTSLILETYLSKESFLDKFQVALVFLIILHVVTKFVNILANQEEVQELMDKIDEIRLEALMDSDARDYMLKADASAKIYSKTLALFGMLHAPSSFVVCILNFYFSTNPSPELIVPCWVPWERKEFGKYVAAQAVVAILCVSSSSVFIVSYILICNIIIQLKAFIRALQSTLERNPMNKRIHRQHVEIIQLLNQCNNLFSGQLYLEILISTIRPCGFGYMAITLFRSKDPRSFDALYKFLLTIIFPFVLCNFGQEISTEIEKLHESAYMGPWEDSTPTVRKNLLILMTITTQLQELNYKKFVIFNLPAFTKVAQGIYSYLTMMININN